MTTAYNPMINAVADEVITDADYPPVPTTRNAILRQKAADLKQAVTDIHEHWESTYAVDGVCPVIDWETYNTKKAALFGTLMAMATSMAIHVDVYCDD